jgi:hypothetical protein
MATRSDILSQIKKEAQLREKINESLNGYTDHLKEIGNLKKTLNHLLNKEAEQTKLVNSLTGQRRIEEDAVLKEIEKQRILTEKTLKTYKKLRNETSNLKKGTEFLRGSWNDTTKVLIGVSNIYDTIVNKTKYLIDIDKKIKMSALSMGILDTQTKSFRKSLAAAGQVTNAFGIDQGQLAEMQAAYSQELGRTVMLGKDGLVAIGAMAAATGLGADGAAKMASDFELIGYSAERTGEFIEQTMNDSSKMGLNASKVIKAISNNIKLLNKYNFKDGVAGLKKMAETTTRLGVDMNFATGMADKLFDIEGAVKMSAELQVLGGAFSNLADPMHLMFMGRNDVAGLTEEIGKATSEFFKLNNETGEFETSGLELHRMRKIAEAAGLSLEELAQAGRNAKKFSTIEGQVSFNIDKDEKEFLINTAKFENGKAYIEVNGEKKFLNMLGQSGRTFIQDQIKQKKSLADRAKDAQTFDETINNFINGIKQLFMPIMPVLDTFATALIKSLTPVVNDLAKYLETVDWGDFSKKIAGFAEIMSDVIKWFVKNPGLGILSIGLLEAGKWYLMGVSFGTGFNSVANKMFNKIPGVNMTKTGLKGVGTGTKMIKSAFKGGFKGSRAAAGAKTLLKGAGKATLPLAALGVGIDAYQNLTDENLDKTDALIKTLDQNKYMASGAALGASLGLFGGPFAPITVPGGALIGGGIGGIADFATSFREDEGLFGDYKKMDDGIVFNPKDKFMKVNDATMIAGTEVGGNKKLDEAISGNGNVTHRFEELKISGDITISLLGGNKISTELINDPTFIKNMTRLVNIQISENINGKK